MTEIWKEFNKLRSEEIHHRINSSRAKQEEEFEKRRDSITELSNEVEAMLEQHPEIRESRPFRGLVYDIQDWRFDDSMTNSSSGSGIFGLSYSRGSRTPNDDRSDSLNPSSHRYNPGRRK